MSEKPEGNLRVSRLSVLNFRRIVALNIEPGQRSLVILRGQNEAGKTSAINSLIAALAGKKEAPEVPVHTGAEDAQIEVTLADALADRYRVRRTFKNNRTYLTVFQLGGEFKSKVTPPQTALDSLISDLSFDPLAFANAKDSKEQVRLLLKAIGKEEEYNSRLNERNVVFDRRREVNNDVATAQVALPTYADVPEESLTPRSEDEVVSKIEAANSHNKEIDELEHSLRHKKEYADGRNHALRESHEELERLQEQIETQRQQIATANNEITNAEAAILAKGGRKNIDDISPLLKEIRDHNELCSQQVKRNDVKNRLNQSTTISAELTTKIADIDKQIVGLLTDSDLGEAVKGLSIVDGVLHHNGVPFTQASGMRRLELSCMVGMAGNPKLRVITIDEADQLDDEAVNRLLELAKKHDYSVWMTSIRIPGKTDDDKYFVDLEDGVDADNKPDIEGAARLTMAEVAVDQLQTEADETKSGKGFEL